MNLIQQLEEESKKDKPERTSSKENEISNELKLVKDVWNSEKINRSRLSPYGRNGNKETEFKATSEVYFREYDIPEDGYFEKDKTVLNGKHPTSFKEKTGIPKDHEEGKDEPELYTYYTYPRLESDM